MKLLVLTVLASLRTSLVDALKSHLKSGDVFPDFGELPNEKGESTSLARFPESRVLLWYFREAGSKYCTDQGTRYRDAIEKYQEFGVQVVGLSEGSPEVHANFSDVNGFNYPLLSDPDHKVAESLGLPFGKDGRWVVLINADGYIEKIWEGVKPMAIVNEVLGWLRRHKKDKNEL
jgi:peroxiredoxin Q/BCP